MERDAEIEGGIWFLCWALSPAIRPLGEIPVGGWVNGLAFTNAKHHLVACSGPHHRFGRWLATAKGTPSPQATQNKTHTQREMYAPSLGPFFW